MPMISLMVGEATRPQLEGFHHFNALCEVVPRSFPKTAPLNSSGDHSNLVTPDAAEWSRFALRMGLRAYFNHPQRGLTRSRPLVTPLVKYHIEALRRDQRHDLLKRDVVRLNWLEWWIRWAIRECEHPVFGCF